MQSTDDYLDVLFALGCNGIGYYEEFIGYPDADKLEELLNENNNFFVGFEEDDEEVILRLIYER